MKGIHSFLTMYIPEIVKVIFRFTHVLFHLYFLLQVVFDMSEMDICNMCLNKAYLRHTVP